jgi:hypothetical protein
MSNYTVKGVKNFIGREGHGFNATLYRDGKKIAFVSDMADGGCLRFDWEDRSEAAPFEAYAATQPPLQTHGMVIPCDGDLYASRLVENLSIEKKLKAGLKKKTYFIHDGACYTNKSPYTAYVGSLIKERYKGAVILNERPFDEAFKLFEKYAVSD